MSRIGIRITQRGWAEIAQVFADYGATVEPVICEKPCLPGMGEHHKHLTEYGHREFQRITPLLKRDLEL